MMIKRAIRTRWHGPTNTKGSRIRAHAGHKSIYVSWNYELGVDENHYAAAMKLLKILGWDDHGIIGGIFDHDYFWTLTDKAVS